MELPADVGLEVTDGKVNSMDPPETDAGHVAVLAAGVGVVLGAGDKTTAEVVLPSAGSAPVGEAVIAGALADTCAVLAGLPGLLMKSNAITSSPTARTEIRMVGKGLRLAFCHCVPES